MSKTRLELLNEFSGVPDDTLYTQAEVAKILGRSVSTMSRERYQGTGIPFIKIGGGIRYRKSDVTEFVNKSSVTGSRS